QTSRNTSIVATSAQSKKTLYLCQTGEACTFSGRRTLKAATPGCDSRVTLRHARAVHRNAH
ncbi:hypothetical protein N308_03718, partial [Struthio camelus australis]